MSKIIRVESCGGCPLRAYRQDTEDFSKGVTECYHDDTPETIVTEHEKNKTIHPDCPLETLPFCNYCGDIKSYEGDAPLPEPLKMVMYGMVEHHCGYEGAPSPRFTFRCPHCNLDKQKIRQEATKHIRAVWEKYEGLEQYKRDKISWHKEFQDAIKADLGHADSEEGEK